VPTTPTDRLVMGDRTTGSLWCTKGRRQLLKIQITVVAFSVFRGKGEGVEYFPPEHRILRSRSFYPDESMGNASVVFCLLHPFLGLLGRVCICRIAV